MHIKVSYVWVGRFFVSRYQNRRNVRIAIICAIHRQSFCLYLTASARFELRLLGRYCSRPPVNGGSCCTCPTVLSYEFRSGINGQKRNEKRKLLSLNDKGNNADTRVPLPAMQCNANGRPSGIICSVVCPLLRSSRISGQKVWKAVFWLNWLAFIFHQSVFRRRIFH